MKSNGRFDHQFSTICMRNRVRATFRNYLFSAAIALWVSSAQAAPPAEFVITNAKIFTSDETRPWASAVAVNRGKIVAIGDARDVAGHIGPSTKREDLGGKVVLPGIVDIHVHNFWAAQNLRNYTCEFSLYDQLAQILEKVKQCAKGKPDGTWIIGEYWSSSLLAELSTPSALRALDAAAGGHPVYLRDDTTHNRWVNSRGMQLAGITRDTPEPTGGKILKDAKTGELLGLFIERPAFLLVEQATPLAVSIPDTQIEEYLGESVRKLNSFGVTSFLDARIEDDAVRQAFSALDRHGGLTAHAGLATLFDGQTAVSSAARMREILARPRSAHVDPRFVKIYLDGVMTTRTAVFIEPYLPEDDGHRDFHGDQKISNDLLVPFVLSMDKMGVVIKFHAAGDGAVRQALDAVAVARRENGDNGPLHQIAHAGYVDDADLKRFKPLRVAVDASPPVWFPGPIDDQTGANIGKDRSAHYWPFRTMMEQGTLVAGGTDWKTLPAEYSELWSGIEGMVTRRNPSGKVAGAMWPDQAITVEQAIRAYTIGSAQAMRIDGITGSLKVGKSADLIVLDRDIFTDPSDKISDTKIVRTVFEGRDVLALGGAKKAN